MSGCVNGASGSERQTCTAPKVLPLAWMGMMSPPLSTPGSTEGTRVPAPPCRPTVAPLSATHCIACSTWGRRATVAEPAGMW